MATNTAVNDRELSFLGSLQRWIFVFREKCPELVLMVIGETGVGKSTLINNLLGGAELAIVGYTTTSETSDINCHKGEVEGVAVKLYDTPGLADSRSERDEEYLEKIKKLIEEEVIHIIIYCMKMSETKMRRGIIRTFEQYTSIGIDWEKTVICLTFADYLPVPPKMKKKQGFNEGQYFEEKLADWKREIAKVLAEKAQCKVEDMQNIKIIPTTGEYDEKLPNGNEWFTPLWLEMLEVMPAPVLVRFLDIHRGNVKLGYQDAARDLDDVMKQLPEDALPKLVASSCSFSDNKTCKEPSGQPQPHMWTAPPNASQQLQQPQLPTSINITTEAPSVSVNQSPSISVSNMTKATNDSDSECEFTKPKIILEGKTREKFEETVGKTIQEEANHWNTVGAMTTGGIVGGAATTLGTAAAVVWNAKRDKTQRNYTW